jgi:hypothetical protein
MFGPTPQKMEGLCYVMPVTGHKAYTGKKEEEESTLVTKYTTALTFSNSVFYPHSIFHINSSTVLTSWSF